MHKLQHKTWAYVRIKLNGNRPYSIHDSCLTF